MLSDLPLDSTTSGTSHTTGSSELWDDALKVIARKLSAQNFDLWFRPIRCQGIDGHTIRLLAPNQFIKEWFETHYQQVVLEVIGEGSSRPYSISWTIDENHADDEPAPEPAAAKASPSPPKAVSEPPRPSDSASRRSSSTMQRGNKPSTENQDLGQELLARYIFDSFVIGPSNQLAAAASRAVADNPGGKYNPLFIYGGVGLGKTHLLLGHVLQAKQDDEGAVSAYRRALEGAAEPRFQLRLAAILQRAPEHVAEARRLADEVPFEAGELSQWLAIAKAETDPDRALRLATHLLASADLVTSLATLGVIAKASRDEAQALSIMKETIKTRPRSPGALICILTVLTLSIQAGGAPDEHWPVFEALLRHPHWKVEPLRVGALVGPAVLRWARRDSTRILALLEGLDASVALNPVVVAMRLALGGDVSDAPAELLHVASDLVNVLTEHEST